MEEEIISDESLLEDDEIPEICNCGECEECIKEKGECTCGDCEVCLSKEEDEDEVEDLFDDIEPEDLI
ncbi:hypothetical protein KKG48_02100 [Patescibacteria group bacterium]|nr:hypothetical protein [Patescibacteria group bacterium]